MIDNLAGIEIPEGTDAEKLIWIENYVKDRFHYSYDETSGYLAQGLMDGSVKCGGFTSMKYLLLLKADIPAQYVYGTYDSNHHAWVLALIDGN